MPTLYAVKYCKAQQRILNKCNYWTIGYFNITIKYFWDTLFNLGKDKSKPAITFNDTIQCLFDLCNSVARDLII